MRNSKIYAVLESLDKTEHTRFKKFLRSPYFNSSPKMMALYEALAKHINADSSERIMKEKLWRKVMGKEEFDDVRWRKLCSDLYKLIEQFLIIEKLKRDEVKSGLYLLESYSSRNIDKSYTSTLNKLQKANASKNLSSEKLYMEFQLQKDFFESQNLELDRDNPTNLNEILNTLDQFYLAEKLKYYSSASMRSKVLSHSYDDFLINDILSLLEKQNPVNLNPLVNIHYHTLLLQIDENNLDHFYELKNLLRDHSGNLTKQLIIDNYTYVINFCIRKANRGDRNFYIEFLEINEDLLETGVFDLGELSPWKYQNIVFAACRIGRYQWAKDFINKYKEALPRDYQENAVSYNLARVHYYEKEFEKVVELLRYVEYEDFSYNLGSKGLLIRTYYELDEIEPLYSLMDAFRTYLKRHEKDIAEQRRKNWLNLIRFVRKLTKILPGDQKAIDKFRKELEETEAIAAEKKWLEEKVAELE